MIDRTNYVQSVAHILKGNLGAGILAMPLSVKHLGYVSAFIALPLICCVSAYCVHILVKSSRKVSKRLNNYELDYSLLARRSFELGPRWLNGSGEFIGRFVDTALLVTQIGVCCVYIIFVVDNITSILASYHIRVSQMTTFFAVLPAALALSCIRTLNRLSIASLIANLLQVVGLMLIIEYLLRDVEHITFKDKRAFTSANEMALGFGSVMFAYEGISVVLPVYNRLKKREQFGSFFGVVNVSFFIMLVLYFVVGLLGFLRYGSEVKDSITLNLPAEPLYDAVRAMFTLSILLTYPLQFYVPNQIIWEWSKKRFFEPAPRWSLGDAEDGANKDPAKSMDVVVVPVDGCKGLETKSSILSVATLEAANLAQDGNVFQGLKSDLNKPMDDRRAHQIKLSQRDSTVSLGSKAELVGEETSSSSGSSTGCETNAHDHIPVRYEYYCRLILVLMTFTLAICIPKLNLLMDLIGSFSGTLLCLTIPASIHLAVYWTKLRGCKGCLIILIDSSIIVLSLSAGLGGAYSSLMAIIKSSH